jgi:hypothetical protein
MILSILREIYDKKKIIPLHEPKFVGNEKKYLNQCIDTTFVSSVENLLINLKKKLQNIQELNMLLLQPMALQLFIYL